MQNESSLEQEHCEICRFPLKLLKIRTTSEHMQKCKARNLPQLKCSAGIYCQSRMESHYQVYSHDGPPPSGRCSTKAEILNNDHTAFPSFIDLTDSQASSQEDFTPSMTSALKNRSNFLKSFQMHKSKLVIPSTAPTRKRRVSKKSPFKQEDKQSLKNKLFSGKSTQAETPFSIARQQRRYSQHRKSKLNSYECIDLTLDSSSTERGVFTAKDDSNNEMAAFIAKDGNNNGNEASTNNQSNVWKHSKIVNHSNSSSSENDVMDKPFVTVHKSPRKLKRPFLSSTQKDSAMKKLKIDLSSVLEMPSNSDCNTQTQKLNHNYLKDKASDCQDNIVVKDSGTACENIAAGSSGANASSCQLPFSISNSNVSTQSPAFEVTQVSDGKTLSSMPTTLETLDSEDFSTPPPRGPGFVPAITPIRHANDANHGMQVDSDEEEDFFTMSPSNKSSEGKLVGTMSCHDQVEILPKTLKQNPGIKHKQAESDMQINPHEKGLSFRGDTDNNKDGSCGNASKEDVQTGEKKFHGNKPKHGLQVNFDENDDFHIRSLEISMDESLDETILCSDEKNHPPQFSRSNNGNEIASQANPLDSSSRLRIDHENMPTGDDGLSFSDPDQDDYGLLDFASAATVPFMGPPDVMKDLHCNALSVDKEIANNIMVDRMDDFKCGSVNNSTSSSRNTSSGTVKNMPAFDDIESNLSIAPENGTSNISDVTIDHGSTTKAKPSKIGENVDNGKLIETVPATVFFNKLAKRAPDQALDISQTGVSNTQYTIHKESCGRTSPMLKTFLLPSPKDVKIVQRHPIQKKDSTSRCTRKLVFNNTQCKANCSTSNERKGDNSNVDIFEHDDTGRSQPSISETSTEAAGLSSIGSARNMPLSTSSSMPHRQPNIQDKKVSIQDNSREMSDPAASASNITVSTSGQERTKAETCKPQTHAGTASCETVDVSQLDPRDSNRDAASKISQSNGNLERKELKVRSNVLDSQQNIQPDRSAGKGLVESLAKENSGKQKKQGDIGAMFFGMKPKVKEELTEPGNSTRNYTKRFRDGYSKKPRSCPFYKKIAGTDIAVDAFSYGPVPGINFYFLSHFHFDHYMGLHKRDWKDRIYCGQVTGNLLAEVMRIPHNLIIRLPLWEESQIGNVRVTLLDANHCPGAVLFVFKLKSNNVILHTGDFRATPEMERYVSLKDTNISSLYLDTTYLNPEYCFPRQSAAIEAAVTIVMKCVQECKETLFVVGSYDIGKERVFCSIAKALKSKIYIIPKKMNIVKCLENEEISNLVTTKASAACKVHVIPMRLLNIKNLKPMLSKHRSFNQIVAIKPTGWAQGRQTGDLSLIKPTESENVKIYGLPYSEHSSFDELRRFVKFIKPKRVIPTVNVAREETRNNMNFYLNAWKVGKDV